MVSSRLGHDALHRLLKVTINTDVKTLSQLPIGETAVISAVHGDRHLRRRLLELGLLPGTEVRLVRRAPFGDAIEVRLRGYSLSIRESEAAGVRIGELIEDLPLAAE